MIGHTRGEKKFEVVFGCGLLQLWFGLMSDSFGVDLRSL